MQSTVRQFQTTGLPGEIARDSPIVAQPWNIDSSGTPNVFGYAYTQSADQVAEVGGALQPFLGILINPKEHAFIGTSAGTLTPTNTIPDNQNGTLCNTGILYVLLDAAGTVGDPIFYTDATGALGIGTAGAGETQIPGAFLAEEDITGAGLAIVQFNKIA